MTRSRTDASITSDHIHDVAKLLFAFSTFWMYIWFSQAMLIWYTNMPEEASWYSVRGFGNWGVLMWATVALMWVVLSGVAPGESETKSDRAAAGVGGGADRPLARSLRHECSATIGPEC